MKSFSESDIGTFLRSLDYCTLHDFSSYGFFGMALDPKERPLLSRSDLIEITHFQNFDHDKLIYPSVPQTQFELKLVSGLDEKYSQYIHEGYIGVNKNFKDSVLALANQLGETSIVDSQQVIKQANEIISYSKNSKGICIAISVKDGNVRNIINWQQITPGDHRKLLGFFSYPNPKSSELSATELLLYKGNRLNLNEINELRAIRSASQYYEQLTALRNDWGGWTGNVVGSFCRNNSNCGEEASTVEYFFQFLREEKVLRNFIALTSIVEKSTLKLFNKHVSNLLVSKRTGEFFVLDSWVVDGGQPASILTLPLWLSNHKSTNYCSDTLTQCGAE
jgi:hypothetical protein